MFGFPNTFAVTAVILSNKSEFWITVRWTELYAPIPTGAAQPALIIVFKDSSLIYSDL